MYHFPIIFFNVDAIKITTVLQIKQRPRTPITRQHHLYWDADIINIVKKASNNYRVLTSTIDDSGTFKFWNAEFIAAPTLL